MIDFMKQDSCFNMYITILILKRQPSAFSCFEMKKDNLE